MGLGLGKVSALDDDDGCCCFCFRLTFVLLDLDFWDFGDLDLGDLGLGDLGLVDLDLGKGTEGEEDLD